MTDTPASRGPTGVFAGQPPGLRTLFFAELWERFSYYGMRALLTLFIVAPAAAGGLGLSTVDAARIYGRLELLATGEAEAVAEVARASVRDRWDAAVATLPEDWSDVYAELELRSTDHHDPAALLLSPLNPTRIPDKAGFRFRIATRGGYGGTAAMARRCFERLDEAGIPGELQVLWAVCDVDNVGTQGPVWYVGGRPV